MTQIFNPLAIHIAYIIFGAAGIFFAVMATDALRVKKSRLLLLAIALLGLSLFLVTSFDNAVTNVHLSDAARNQAFWTSVEWHAMLTMIALMALRDVPALVKVMQGNLRRDQQG